MSDPDIDVEDTGRQRVSARSVAIWGARATGGIIGVAVAAVVVIGAVLVTPPSWSVTPPVVEVTPEPAAQTLVCPGSLLRLADDSGGNANEATPIGGVPTVRFTAASGSLARSPIEQSDAGTGGTSRAPQVARIDPEGGEAAVASGIQSTRIAAAEGNVVGYAATSCLQPALRSWVIGGSTQLGRTSILTIVNPTNVEAIVDLDLHGELGGIDAAGLEGIVVPPGSQRVIPVSGFALDQRAPVIGIESSGGNVAVFLQESIIRTLTPGGVDLSGQQTPSETLVIPGIQVAGKQALTAINTTEIDEDDTMPTLRLFAPGPRATEATVSLVPDGAVLADALANPRVEDPDAPTDAHVEAPTEPTAMSFSVPLEPGAVVELPIQGVAPGEYTIVVSADEPLVGAVRASVTSSAGTDFAWYSPAGELADRVVVATPSADSVVLAIANDGSSERSVTMTGPEGELPLVIPAGGTLLVPLESAADVELRGMQGLRAALRAGGDGLVAQTPLQPPPALARPVHVHV